MTKTCVDCQAGAKRKVVYPGPRCREHHIKVTQARTAKTHDAYVVKTYGLRPGQYAEIYAAQGGRCYICERATGATRRLAVDHDHASGYVRGLLCKPCNRMLGLARDDVEFFRRAIAYLDDPPAQELGIWARPTEGN